MNKRLLIPPCFLSIFFVLSAMLLPSFTFSVKAACPGITMLDTSQNNMNMVNGAAGFYADAITAAISAPSTIQLRVTDRAGTFTQTTSGTSLSFSLFSVAKLKSMGGYRGYKPGDKISYQISFTGGCGTSSTSTISFIPNTAPLDSGCQSHPGEVVIATDTKTEQLQLLTGDLVNRCQVSTTGSTEPQTLQVDPNPSNPFYNQNAKDFQLTGCGLNRDSIIYYPSSLGNGNLVFVTTNGCGNGSGKMYALYWSWVKHVPFKKIDTSSVRVIPVLMNMPYGVDMEIDDLNGGNPSYFWVSEQGGKIWRIRWSMIDSIIAPWLSSISSGGNTPGGNPISVINPAQCPNCLFTKPAGSNGMSVISSGSNGYLYTTSTPTGQGNPSLNVYNAKGGTNPSATVIPVPLNHLQGLQLSGGNILSNGGWYLDGITVANHYLYISSGNGSVIWVYDLKNPASPKLIGPAITNIICSGTGSAFDGIEIDQDQMMYIACGFLHGSGGIYVVNTNDINQSALLNQDGGSAQIFKGSQVAGHPFIQGDAYDDLSPLSGHGSMYQSYTPYYQTREGNVYSYGGYSISALSNDPETLKNAYFSSDLLLAQTGTNIFKSSASGSYWNWNFKNVELNLNHTPTSKNIAVYNHDALYSLLCFNPNTICQKITAFNSAGQSDTITQSDSQINTNIYSYTPTSGTLNIDMDNNGVGGLNENGILFVDKQSNGKGGYSGGNVHIIVDRNDDWATNPKRLLIIAAGNVTIDPSPAGGSSNGSVTYQHMNISIIADGVVTFNPYNAKTGVFPQNPQPIQALGSIMAWGRDLQGNLVNGSTIQFAFDAGFADEFDPAVKITYDPSYLLKFSKFFPQTSASYEIGI